MNFPQSGIGRQLIDRRTGIRGQRQHTAITARIDGLKLIGQVALNDHPHRFVVKLTQANLLKRVRIAIDGGQLRPVAQNCIFQIQHQPPGLGEKLRAETLLHADRPDHLDK